MRKLIVLFLLIIIVFFISKVYEINKTEYIKENYVKDKINIYILTIDKIKIKEIVRIETIQSNKIKGVILFKEFGRPDQKYTNTILGAHSGAGRNAIFANIDKLEIGDELKFYYEKKEYKYSAIDKFFVKDSDLSILNNVKNKTTIMLLTCKEFNNKYRLIVVFELIDFI